MVGIILFLSLHDVNSGYIIDWEMSLLDVAKLFHLFF